MLSHHPSKVSAAVKRAKKRGSYNCGRCGVPKKGHVCNAVGDPISVPSNPTPPRSNQQLRRSLSFDDALSSAEEDDDVETAVPSICLSEVMRRLPPPALLSAAQVCRGWRDCARRVWRSAEELRLRVPPLSQVWFVGSVLRRCTGLVRLSLRIERLGELNT